MKIPRSVLDLKNRHATSIVKFLMGITPKLYTCINTSYVVCTSFDDALYFYEVS